MQAEQSHAEAMQRLSPTYADQNPNICMDAGFESSFFFIFGFFVQIHCFSFSIQIIH